MATCVLSPVVRQSCSSVRMDVCGELAVLSVGLSAKVSFFLLQEQSTSIPVCDPTELVFTHHDPRMASLHIYLVYTFLLFRLLARYSRDDPVISAPSTPEG